MYIASYFVNVFGILFYRLSFLVFCIYFSFFLVSHLHCIVWIEIDNNIYLPLRSYIIIYSFICDIILSDIIQAGPQKNCTTTLFLMYYD